MNTPKPTDGMTTPSFNVNVSMVFSFILSINVQMKDG